MTPNPQSVCKWCASAMRMETFVGIPEPIWVALDGAVFCPKFAKPMGHEPSEPASLNAPAGTEGQDGWVKVEDRLPEFHKQVLVAIVTSHARWVETAMRTIDGWYSPVRNSPLEGVTCWQPMPQPPEAV